MARPVRSRDHRAAPAPSPARPARWWRIYVDDATAVTVAVLERGRAGHAYDIVDYESVRWREFLDTLGHAIGAPPPARCPAGCSP
jgi:nucleoside-diphosphate-sugar epimerase